MASPMTGQRCSEAGAAKKPIAPERPVIATVRRVFESRAFVPSCMLAAVILRVVCVVAFPVQPISDFDFYYSRAVDLAAGKGMVLHGAPTAYWPAGYSLFLAAIFVVTGPSLAAALAANIVLAVASLWLAHWITMRITGSRLAAAVALAAMAFHPNQIAFCALTANETLATFMILAGVALILRLDPGRSHHGSRLVLCGVVFGLGCLVKPQIVVLPTACLLWIAWRERHGWRRALTSLLVVNLAIAATITPWTIRNWRSFGHFVFIANTGGINLYLGNNALATGAYPNPEAERNLSVILHSFGTNEYAIDRAAAHEAVQYIASHPMRVLELLPAKLWHLYAKDVDGFSWIAESANGAVSMRTAWTLKVLAELYYVALIALFATALLWPRRGVHGVRPPNALPLVITAVFTAVYLVYFGNGRYHLPLVPWLAIYAGAFVAAFVTATARAPSEPALDSALASFRP